MSYLDTLIESKKSVEDSSDVPNNHKLVLIELIEKAHSLEVTSDDPFFYFYSDVTNREDIFEFKSVLKGLYTDAQQHASSCIKLFIKISQLEENEELHIWLSSAIRVVDCIAMHYLQEVLEEEAIKQGDAGKERSRYIQINRKEIKAEKAGRIMDDLYEERNKMEHRTKNDPENPSKQILITPNFRRARKKILKRFPEALNCFDSVYKTHYESA